MKMSFIVNKILPAKNIFLKPLNSSMRALSISKSIGQKISTKIDITSGLTETENKLATISSAKEGKEILKKIRTQLEQQKEGRLFAIVQLCGKQFKITSGDIILVEGYWPPTIGDRIRLEKVLLAGSNDFTLIGKPILQKGVCDVQATIIEKTLTHTKTNFRKKARKQYMRINFYRSPNTMIRINSIELNSNFNNEEKNDKELRIF